MTLQLHFHGAAGTVTGSCMELRAADWRVLIDCGLFQGSRTLEALNHQGLPFDIESIDAVLLTHAHLDHCGRLPLFGRAHAEAPVWCTPATRQLLEPLLLDAAKIQAADARRRNRRPDRAGLPPFEALYDARDVRRLIESTRPIEFGQWAEPVAGVRMRFVDARHVLGAASIELEAEGQRLLFSGDIGMHADEVLAGGHEPFDHVVCESTYGDRDRVQVSLAERREKLAGLVEPALAGGGNLLIPAFALERTQAVLGDLVALFESGRLQPSPIFVDSPLAERITHTYRRYAGPEERGSYDSPHVRFTPTEAQSRALHRLSGAIIIAGSGMCTGGRIRQHLIRNLPRGDSTVLIVGYQARGTLGSVLLSSAPTVRISGNDVRVKARIESTDIYSAHADREALLRWLAAAAPVRGSVFLDHGEPLALEGLRTDAARIKGLPAAIVPALGESYRLEAGRPAERVGTPRPDAAALVQAEDWKSRFAAFAASLEDRLRALPSDEARRRAIEAADRALREA